MDRRAGRRPCPALLLHLGELRRGGFPGGGGGGELIHDGTELAVEVVEFTFVGVGRGIFQSAGDLGLLRLKLGNFFLQQADFLAEFPDTDLSITARTMMERLRFKPVVALLDLVVALSCTDIAMQLTPAVFGLVEAVGQVGQLCLVTAVLVRERSK